MLSAIIARAMASERFRKLAGYIGLGFAALALLGAVYAAYKWHVASEVEQARADDALEAARMDAVADDIAGQIAASEAATVEGQNDDARKAANTGNDPLGDGLRSLRKRTPSDR